MAYRPFLAQQPIQPQLPTAHQTLPSHAMHAPIHNPHPTPPRPPTLYLLSRSRACRARLRVPRTAACPSAGGGGGGGGALRLLVVVVVVLWGALEKKGFGCAQPSVLRGGGGGGAHEEKGLRKRKPSFLRGGITRKCCIDQKRSIAEPPSKANANAPAIQTPTQTHKNATAKAKEKQKEKGGTKLRH